MSNSYPIRNSVRIILLNDVDELLLVCIDDPKTKPIGGKYRGSFWTLIGGQIENNETIQQAATRELFEETGLKHQDVELGPVIWFGEIDLVLYGKPTHIKEKYIVARTSKKRVSPSNLTKDETGIVKQLAWFSLDQILRSKETIYPILLPNYLRDIIAGKYPKEPIKINLATEERY